MPCLYVASGFSRTTPGPTKVGRHEEQPLRERWTFDEFEHQRLHAARFLEPIDSGDVGMVQRREDSRFTLEPREAIGIEGEDFRQDFEGNVAIQLRVARAVDFALSHRRR